MASFYRRPLPDGLVAFSSPEGRVLFREALDAGGMDGWFALAEHFHTQSEPAFCALGSLVVVLNALAIDPERTWKGPWRWYSEDMLDCCEPLDVVRERGLSLPQFVCLARCNGATTSLRRPDGATVDDLRADLRDSGHVIASFSRAALGQTGDGHFSPLGGWHPARDLVLVLDVARFKYPPFWVPLPTLWQAMRPHDPATGRSRGWVRLDRDPRAGARRYRIACERPGWREDIGRLPEAFAAARAVADPEQAVRVLAATLPPAVRGLVAAREGAEGLVRTSRLYEVLAAHVPDAEAVALLVLVAPEALLPQAACLRAGLPPELLAEVEALRAQMEAVGECLGGGCG